MSELESRAYEQLNLTRLSNGETKLVASQLLACGGLGAAGLAGLLRLFDSHRKEWRCTFAAQKLEPLP